MRVVGVDGIPAGWVAVALEEGRFLDMRAFRRFADVIEASPQAAAIGVDIPIGLPGDIPGDGGMRRAADEQARERQPPARDDRVPVPGEVDFLLGVEIRVARSHRAATLLDAHSH